MIENREPRFVDEEQRQQLRDNVVSLVGLINELEGDKWEITEDRINWIDIDLGNLKRLQEKMEYTYYVE